MSKTDSYYSNLLILQYHNKPKAKATIEASVSLLPDSLIQEVTDGFDLNTAVGKQLDILGEYIGLSRGYIKDGVVSLLGDEDYRTLLQLKALCNSSDFSHKSIDDAMYKMFGTAVRMDSTGMMDIRYFVNTEGSDLILAAIQKGVLPKPMGVRLDYIEQYDVDYFGFCDYNDLDTFYKTGFGDYNDPDKEGEMLTYEKRI